MQPFLVARRGEDIIFATINPRGGRQSSGYIYPCDGSSQLIRERGYHLNTSDLRVPHDMLKDAFMGALPEFEGPEKGFPLQICMQLDDDGQWTINFLLGEIIPSTLWKTRLTL